MVAASTIFSWFHPLIDKTYSPPFTARCLTSCYGEFVRHLTVKVGGNIDISILSNNVLCYENKKFFLEPKESNSPDVKKRQLLTFSMWNTLIMNRHILFEMRHQILLFNKMQIFRKNTVVVIFTPNWIVVKTE